MWWEWARSVPRLLAEQGYDPEGVEDDSEARRLYMDQWLRGKKYSRELLATSETTLLAMERACWLNPAGEPANVIQLFTVTLAGNTARKTLLLDLSSLEAKLSPALAHLDNFEGLAFGPPVNGRPTLLAMSDDNFRPTQKTSFLLFGMR